MENNELNLPNANEEEGKKENVFTKEVKPIEPFQYFLIGVGNTLKKIGLWLADLLYSIVMSILHFVGLCVVGVFKGIYGIYKYIARKVHQFKYNDLYGRLSYIWLGASNFKHKQYVNGVIYTLIEIGFILFMALGGGYNIYMLGSLGLVEYNPGDPDDMFAEVTLGDNSIIILILGIVSLLVVLAFVFIWLKNIDTGYDNYRIDNFVKYDKIFKKVSSYTDKIDAECQEAFAKHLNRFEYKRAARIEVDDYLASLNIQDKKVEDFIRYLISETVSSSYDYLQKLRIKDYKIKFTQNLLDRYVHERENSLYILSGKNRQAIAKAPQEQLSAVTEKANIAIEKHNNKTNLGIANRKEKLKKLTDSRTELVKTHASFGAVQDTKNNDKYGKFNRYFSDIALLDGEINFLKNYGAFVEKYNGSLDGYEAKNQENTDRIVELKNEMVTKLAATKAKFDEIRSRKAELEAQLKVAKDEYRSKVKEAISSGIPEDALLEDKAILIDKTTRLMGAMRDLPSDKSIRALEREENRESKHSYNRDRKYLKTNFTAISFAKEEVINLMILEYRISYEDAVYYTESMFVQDKGSKEKRFLNAEEVETRLNNLIARRETYVQAFPDRYNGRSETFKEQMKSLLNDKFHMTILALPFLGILLFTVLPLIFSLLIAFTNFDYLHTPPTKLFTWVGFANFMRLINPAPDDELASLSIVLMDTFSWTMIWAVFATFSNYFLGIIVALMINKDGIKCKTLWRTIFVMTIAIPAFVSLLTISQMLNDGGVLQKAFGIGFGSLDFTEGATVTKTIILLVNIWVGIPYTMLSTTGILLNIPKDLYESSKVDGAGAVTQFFKITMPYILFVTGPYLITSFVGNINNFNVIYFLSGGGPRVTYQAGAELNLGKTDLMITFIYKIVTNPAKANFGLASTIGIFVFAICAFFSLIMYNKSGSIQQEDQFQ